MFIQSNFFISLFSFYHTDFINKVDYLYSNFQEILSFNQNAFSFQLHTLSPLLKPFNPELIFSITSNVNYFSKSMRQLILFNFI